MLKPKKLSDLISIDKQINQLKHCINDNIPALLAGVPGVGKTSSTYLLAKELGYTVVETNASDSRKRSDLLMFYKQCRAKALQPTVFLLDEIDGLKAWGTLKKIITNPQNPIVCTCNDSWKIPQNIRNLFTVIEYKLYKRDFDPIARKIQKLTGKTVKILGDARQMMKLATVGGDGYDRKNVFEKIDLLFKKGDYTAIDDENLLYWIVHNAMNFYSGFELFEVLYWVAKASETERMEYLKFIPESWGKLEYPYFFRRRKALMEAKKCWWQQKGSS
jgi:DNA polymerase III delta prime subunit